MADTKKCPNCGYDNDISFSMCSQCLTPLTAYAGQLTGENYSGKLAGQVKNLNRRPTTVPIMAAFDLLFAIFVPLAIFVSSLPSRAVSSAEIEYQSSLSTAFSSVGAVVTGLVMIPLAGVLVWHAWGVFTQRTWAWSSSYIPIGIFVVMMMLKFKLPSSSLHIAASIGLVGVATFLFFWNREITKSWYGL